MLNSGRQTPREYISGESHYYLGRRYRLEMIDGAGSDQPRRRGTESIHGDTREKDEDKVGELQHRSSAGLA